MEKDTPENLLDLTSTVSLNQLLEDYVEEVVSKESQASSMMTPELYSEDSSNKLSEMLLLILNTPEERLLLPWT